MAAALLFLLLLLNASSLSCLPAIGTASASDRYLVQMFSFLFFPDALSPIRLLTDILETPHYGVPKASIEALLHRLPQVSLKLEGKHPLTGQRAANFRLLANHEQNAG